MVPIFIFNFHCPKKRITKYFWCTSLFFPQLLYCRHAILKSTKLKNIFNSNNQSCMFDILISITFRSIKKLLNLRVQKGFKMQNTTMSKLVIGKVNAKVLTDKKAKNDPKIFPIHVLSDLAIELLLGRTLVCYVPSGKLGKDRVLSDTETQAMIEHVRHISPSSYIDFLRMLPLATLEKKSINIIFSDDKDTKIQDHILNMMFLNQYIKQDARNGKLDYLALENSFLADLPQGKKTKDYIASSRRYSYAAVLGINARTFSTSESK